MIHDLHSKKNIFKMRKWQFYKVDKKQKENKVHMIWSGNVLKTQSTKQLENQKNKSEEDVRGIFKTTELKTFWKQLL